MRGQVSLEAFFAFTLFLLLLGWLANYLGAFYSSVSDASVIQEQIVAKDRAMLVNRVCTTNASISFSRPCIYRTNTSAFYGINSSGNVLNVYAPDLGKNWSVPTLCDLNTSFLSETQPGPNFGRLKFVGCDPTDSTPAYWCIRRQADAKVLMLIGECV